MLLLLKLTLVPSFILLVTLAGKRWGPRTAGWLGGMPVVAGPILGFVAWEHGPEFGAAAATRALSAVFSAVSFGAAYAHAAQRLAWPGATAVALLAWTVAAFGLSLLPQDPRLAVGIAAVSLLLAPWVFPRRQVVQGGHSASMQEVLLRMAAGACLTLLVTWASHGLGSAWTGLLTVFPVLSTVLAVFSHRQQGAVFTATLLGGLAVGMVALAAFCATLSFAWVAWGLAPGFAAAVAAGLLAQVATRLAFMRR